MLGFEMGLKPEDSMNAGGDQPERRAFSEQAEIHEEASIDTPLRLVDPFADVRVDTESGVDWLPGLFAAVAIDAAAIVKLDGCLSCRCVAKRRVVMLAAVRVIHPGWAQALMLRRVIGDAAISALCCGHWRGLEEGGECSDR